MPRNPASLLALTVVLLVTIIFAVWMGAAAMVRPGGGILASPQAAAPASPANPTKPAGGNAPTSAQTPGQFLYTAPAAQPIAAIVRRFWPSTQYMTRAELEAAFRQANNLGKATTLKSGQQLV